MNSNIFSLFFCLMAYGMFATHNRSGEITYKRVAPYSSVTPSGTVALYNYSITVTRYTDHGSTVADRCVDTVYFGDGQFGIAPRINGGSTLGCGCGGSVGCGELIVTQPGYTVKKNVYSIVHAYSGTGTYVIHSADPFRNAGIHNIPNSSTTLFYLTAIIEINSLSAMNSSPEFGNAPVNQATIGLCFTEQPSLSDADGDSLVVEVTPCLLAPGYFYPELPPNGSYSLATNTGPLVWCDPIVIGTYHIAYRVIEWRKNASGVYTYIGMVMREREVIVNWGPVGLKETEAPGEFKLLPNPAKDRVQLQPASAQAYSYALYDALGKLISQENNLKGEKSLELASLPSGLYLIKLKQQDRQSCLRLIKE